MWLKVILSVGMLMSAANMALANEAHTPQGLEYCTVCHGSQLKGNQNIGAPRLTSLPAWYLSRQLNNFQQGVRGSHPKDTTGGEMMSMVSTFSDEQIAEIVSWIVSTESTKPAVSLSADAHKGEQLYKTCAACHGVNAQGNEAMGAPNISGLNDWYILTQLNHFRDGIRGGDAEDIYGQQMKAASAIVTTKEEAESLAVYITQLK
ncbi:c-type cytochrome [Pseudoalteromonas sp. MMG010]|uniref:c-type cytochrome n=1 Tax=Pseudoalteromonas sp. MMG010 TaxID=2822685 RepID=UPI001B3A51A6|nr:cytochrome c [Pseudoalteromonas sp. MMG010]MBQ4832975.1 c-type cytochrome [Pseudoalteromonas sp. MMG010]